MVVVVVVVVVDLMKPDLGIQIVRKGAKNRAKARRTASGKRR